MSDLLFLAHRVPYPPDRGDKIRSFNILRHLADRRPVHLIAFADDPADLDPPPEFRARLASCTVVPRTKANALAAIQALATGRPISLTAFADPAMHAAIAKCRAAARIQGVYCFSGQMAQYVGDDLPVIMDFVDVDSTKFQQLAGGSRYPISWLLRREARLLGTYERAVAARVGASLFVTAAEAQSFRDGGATGNILAIENGIDTAYFDPEAPFQRIPAAGPLIVFTGQMDYRPNVDAAFWFARHVLPALRAVQPDLRFAIVGRAPVAAVRQLAGDSVIVTGVVADVRGWLAAASVCVAPLAIARGIQNKVLEAMAMARPVVASAAAATGIDHGDTIRVATDAGSHVDAIRALLDDQASAARLGAAARARAVSRYAWPARLAALDALLP